MTIIIGSLLFNTYSFSFVILIFSQLGLFEFLRFANQKRLDIFYHCTGFFVYVLSHLIFTSVLSPRWASLIFIIPLILLSLELFKKEDWNIKSLAYRIIGYLYVLTPLILLNYLNIKTNTNNTNIILCVFILVWVNDTFAYFTGMLLGKHKLFERITPKKTWEGFIGGLLATLFVAWFLASFAGANNILYWEIAAFFIGISAVFGDFTESFFKRKAGVKDSGKIMPGHGGILDRIDSLLFVFPIVYIYFELVN